jgi:2,5-furandicarboxylate decarboxylase 1
MESQKDLRTFSAEARQLGATFFQSIERPISTIFESCVIQQKLASEGRFPLLRFENVSGSEMPLVSNLFGSYDLLGLAMGIQPGGSRFQVLEAFRARSAQPLKPREIEKSEAPVKQVVVAGSAVDLEQLPIIHHSEGDSGKYITCGVLVLRDPDSGVINTGMYRHEVKSKNSLACMFNPAHHAAHIYRRSAELKQKLEAVLFIGHHPAALIGSLAEGSIETSELDIMGGLMNEPLLVTRAETVDLPVPACAEIVIEGFLDPENETSDGPFAEFTNYYGPSKDPVGLMHITSITYRKDAIFHDLDPAHQEHNLANALSLESCIFDGVKRLVPSVHAVSVPVAGSCRFMTYVSIEKKVAGQGKSAGLAAIASNPNIKMAIVVDHDVDIYDDARVLWAVNTCMEADRDLTMIPNALGSHLNPSSYGEVRDQKGPMNTKIIMDATRPVERAFEEPIRPPSDVWNRIKLEEWLS